MNRFFWCFITVFGFLAGCTQEEGLPKRSHCIAGIYVKENMVSDLNELVFLAFEREIRRGAPIVAVSEKTGKYFFILSENCPSKREVADSIAIYIEQESGVSVDVIDGVIEPSDKTINTSGEYWADQN